MEWDLIPEVVAYEVFGRLEGQDLSWATRKDSQNTAEMIFQSGKWGKVGDQEIRNHFSN